MKVLTTENTENTEREFLPPSLSSVPLWFKIRFFLSLCVLCVLCGSTHAAPVACHYFTRDGFFVVQWCDLTPNSEYEIQWTDDPTAFLTAQPPKAFGAQTLHALPVTLDDSGTVEAEIEMTEPMLFVRLVEVSSPGFSPSEKRHDADALSDRLKPALRTTGRNTPRSIAGTIGAVSSAGFSPSPSADLKSQISNFKSP